MHLGCLNGVGGGGGLERGGGPRGPRGMAGLEPAAVLSKPSHC
jgi:hypothetical protein